MAARGIPIKGIERWFRSSFHCSMMFLLRVNEAGRFIPITGAGIGVGPLASGQDSRSAVVSDRAFRHEGVMKHGKHESNRFIQQQDHGHSAAGFEGLPGYRSG